MMTERSIFLAAIEIADAHERAAYVQQACAGDATLQAQVEALLSNHQQASQFLESPAVQGRSAVEQTIVSQGSDNQFDPSFSADSGEADFRQYLQPASRPGWLGRLAHYEIEEILGRGAFGIVAKAFDEKLQRVVAIKLMSPQLAATSPPRKRFLREARTAAAVRHENIVGIHAVEEDPIPYLVMEYIPGETLQLRLDQTGPLEVPEILQIGQQVAAGLAAAHAANLIHRDIKPSNILLDGEPGDRVKISDFGLARAVDDASLTQSGLIAGTPLYMAPEQARGETLDHRADLFSLGSVLYQMASGRPPFRAATTVAVLKRVCEDAPRPIADIIPGTPDWLCTVIIRLLEKDPDDRFQTAKEVAGLLARCQSELQHHGKVTCVVTRTTREAQLSRTATNSGGSNSRGKRAGWLAAGLLAVVAILGVLVVNGLWTKPDEELANPPTSVTEQPAVDSASVSLTSSVGWHGWPADAPSPAIAPFDAAQARRHQEEWAAYLNVPVEHTNSIGMHFMLIPPGEFIMGSTPEEIEAALEHHQGSTDQRVFDRIHSEAPQHDVILTKPVYLGVTEVTQAEYEQVMGTNPSHFSATGDGNENVLELNTSRHPVEMVSWNDAAEFCTKLSQLEELDPFYFRAGNAVTPLDGTGYRLPTEAEWEFACRAGTATKYWSGGGDDFIRTDWINENAGDRTHAVGELKANPFGLVDVHGNVYEWVQDGWDPGFYEGMGAQPALNPDSAFTVSADAMHVIRGGAFTTGKVDSRSSARISGVANHQHRRLGFRVALVVDTATPAIAHRELTPTITPPPSASIGAAGKTHAPAKLNGEQKSTLADRLRAQVAMSPLPEPGQRISPAALVTEPTAINGVRAWTLETPQHRGQIKVCRVSPDGSLLATGGEDSTLRVWNVADQSLSKVLLGHDCPIQSIQWSADGSLLLSAGGNEFCVWDVYQDSLLQRVVNGDSPAARFDLMQAVWGSVEGEVIAFCGDGHIRFWDLNSAKVYKSVAVEPVWIRLQQPFATDSRSERLVVCGQQQPVRVWDSRSGILLHSWEHSSIFAATAISNDGRLVAAGGYGKPRSLFLWNAETGAEVFVDSPLEHNKVVTSLAFSPDGTRLAAAGDREATVYLWDVTTGQRLAGINTPHGAVTALCWSEDGDLLATAGTGTDTVVAFWDSQTSRPRGVIAGGTARHVDSIVWNRHEPTLTVGLRSTVDGSLFSDRHGLATWPLAGGMTEQDTLQVNAPNRELISSADGKWIIGRGLNLFDVSQKVVHKLPIDQKRYFRDVPTMCRAFVPDSDKLAMILRRTDDANDVLCVMEVPGGEILVESELDVRLARLSVSQDGREVAVVGNEPHGSKTLSIHDTTTGERLRSSALTRHEDHGFDHVRWSPDGRLIAVDDVWVVRLCDPGTLDVLGSVGHEMGGASKLKDLVWLNNEQLAGTKNGLVTIWDFAADAGADSPTDHTFHRLADRPTHDFTDLCPSPEGRYLAAASVFADPRVSIWDWSTERVVTTLILPGGERAYPVSIAAAGHFRSLGPAELTPNIIAVVQTDSGQQFLPLEEFSNRYGWSNDPQQVPTLVE